MMTQTMNMIRNGYKKRRGKQRRVAIILIVLLLLLGIFMLVYGDKSYALSTVLKVLLGEEIRGATFAILKVRLPRVVIGILAGIAFGMAGNTFQTMLHNPLASPDIMGVTSGASVAAVFGLLILKLSGNIVSVFAVLSGVFVAACILYLSNGKGYSSGRMILIGIGMQAMLNAIISYLLVKASEYDVATALRWLSGSLNGVRMESAPHLGIVVVIFGGGILLLSKHLKILQLGEELSITLGVRTNVIRLLLMFCSVVLIAFATAVTGPIASVAFLAGPISKRISRTGDNTAISAGLMGALLVLAADLFGQHVLPTRYPVGIITGIIGAPYLLILLFNMKKEGKSAG